MKVTRIVAACVAASLVAATAMAQTATAPATKTESNDDAFLKAGTILYGGSFGYASYLVDAYKANTDAKLSLLKAQANVEYFVIDNLSLGLNANIDWLRGKLAGDVGNATMMLAELAGRYYFPVCKDKFFPYVGAFGGAGYGMASISSGAGKANTDETMTDWGFQAGILIPLNANVCFDTNVRYTEYQLPEGWRTDLSGVQVLAGFKMKL